MTPLQELAYFRLCLFCWASQDASIPDDDLQLKTMARWAKGTSRVVQDSWGLVRRCFIKHPTKAGFLTNERVFELWEERQKWRLKCSEGGKLSGELRASKGGKRTSKQAKGSSTTLGSKPQVNGNSSSSSSSLYSLTLTDGEFELPTCWQTPQVLDACKAWVAHQLNLGKVFCGINLLPLLNNKASAGWTPDRLARGIEKSLAVGATSNIIDPDEPERGRNGRHDQSHELPPTLHPPK